MLKSKNSIYKILIGDFLVLLGNSILRLLRESVCQKVALYVGYKGGWLPTFSPFIFTKQCMTQIIIL